MRPKFLFLIALMAALFQGCIVKSLHPFYKPENIVFRKSLLSDWTDQDGSKWSIRRHQELPNAYEMHWLKNGDKDVVFLAYLFDLEGELYFDFTPITDNSHDNLAIFDLHLMPTHSVAKLVKINSDEVQIKWFNEDWLKQLFEQNRIRIAHEEILDETPTGENDKWYVLTAPTEELQKFVIKYGHDATAFSNDNSVWLTLKKSV